MNFKSSNKDFDLWRALAVSLALHAAALWQALPQRPVPSAAQPLAATLRPIVGEAAAVSRPVKRRAAASPVHAAARAPAAEPASVAPTMPPEALRSAPSDRPADRLATVAPVASAGPDAEGLRQYRLNLAAAARRFKRYPALAVERGLSGRAEVAVAIAANGMPQPPQLASSSGHELLDEAAVDMIAHAAQATSLPQKLRGQAFAITLPVEFDIDEE